MRQFRDETSDKFDTVEFPCETGARKGGSSKKKTLNLNTYKFHALGDYVATIRLFGTTDSYSTQVVGFVFRCIFVYTKFNCLQGELAHRLVKRLYGLTNKKNAPEQIARHYHRAHHFNASESASRPNAPASQGNGMDESPEFHHTITNSRNNPVELASFSSHRTQDPAAKVGPCTPPCYLTSHLASRILSINSVSISSAGSLAMVLTAMTPNSLQTKNETQFGLSTTSYSLPLNFPLTIQHTMSAVIATQSTLALTPTLCSSPPRLALVLTHIGMPRFSVFIILMYLRPIRQPQGIPLSV